MFVISNASQWLAEGDPVSAVYRMIHTSCAVAVDQSVAVELCVFLLPVYMRCSDVVPLCTAAAVLLHNCVVSAHAAHSKKR